jgi:hypothetical protein
MIHRFIGSKEDIAALPQDAGCATKIPRPGAVLPVQLISSPAEVTQ